MARAESHWAFPDQSQLATALSPEGQRFQQPMFVGIKFLLNRSPRPQPKIIDPHESGSLLLHFEFWHVTAKKKLLLFLSHLIR